MSKDQQCEPTVFHPWWITEWDGHLVVDTEQQLKAMPVVASIIDCEGDGCKPISVINPIIHVLEKEKKQVHTSDGIIWQHLTSTQFVYLSGVPPTRETSPQSG